MCVHVQTYHFDHLQDPEVGLEILQVAPYAPQNVPRVHGLGGGLVRAAGPGDHGSVGGLAVKALRLLGGPHDDFGGGWWKGREGGREGRGRAGLLGQKCYDIQAEPTPTTRPVVPLGAGYVTESTLCSMQAAERMEKTNQTVHFSPPRGETAAVGAA